jgi:hypothetical protein
MFDFEKEYTEIVSSTKGKERLVFNTVLILVGAVLL